MKWILTALAAMAVAFAVPSDSQAEWGVYHRDWWFHYSARQALGPDYRFPPAYYAEADFYYGYLGHPLYMPYWVTTPESWTNEMWKGTLGTVEDASTSESANPRSMPAPPVPRLP